MTVKYIISTLSSNTAACMTLDEVHFEFKLRKSAGSSAHVSLR